jgi:hypothetical protein
MFIFIYINVKNIAFIHTMPHNNYLIMWSCSGNMPKYYPGLRDILLDGFGRVTANQYVLIDCSMDTDCSFIFTDETLTATANAKYLSSPGYPTQYPK